MDQLVQCPVCTLFLHNGMSLESHLDTHPKDQVIKALCSLSKNSNYGSRTPTPLHSERSYRSRSRTPATEESVKWNGSRSDDRYWQRTPSRTPKGSNTSRGTTPASDVRIGDITIDNSISDSGQYSTSPYPMKSDKMQQTYVQNPPMVDFDQPFVYYQDQREDKEIKYSRSTEYTAIDNANNIFTYNVPPMGSGMKIEPALLPSVPKRSNDLVKILPKPNNILFKTNMGGLQYLPPGVKPMHVMMPNAPTFVQKSVQNNMIMAGSMPSQQMLDKAPLSNQFNQITSGSFTPGTTVVTQNSQIIYREMVQNLDGKPFLSSMPVLSGHDNVTNVAQTSSMYQNMMVVDQYGNTSCMYTAPQPLMSKCNTPYNMSSGPSSQVDKHGNLPNEFKKTLVIEVGPIGTSQKKNTKAEGSSRNSPKGTIDVEKTETRNETPGPTKGLKILSNIKVEVPVQHHKNMLNTIMDLTGSGDNDYQERPMSPEGIVSLDYENKTSDESSLINSSAESLAPHTFSVIKNVGNPPSYKDSIKALDNKIKSEFSDSCPMPDLICNEKPSISPCSELSEHGDNSIDRTSISPKLQSSQTSQNNTEFDKKLRLPMKYNNLLRLNNIYVKKNKKVLQVKNMKPLPATTTSSSIAEPTPSSSKSPEDFTVTKLHQEPKEKNTLQTVSIEQIKVNEDHHEFDADTEELSMDIEPVPSSNVSSNKFSTSIDIVQVKEEINTSNEGGYSNDTASDRQLTPLESLRPVCNVITYGNMPPGDFDEDSNHKELLDLEAASKNKHFGSMLNQNYFGENMYPDYFPDRVETFQDRQPSYPDKQKDMYIWGEPSSQKESEFVLPNFIHESYKIAESNYSEIGEDNGCDRESKVDVLCESRSNDEPALNICTDERMPPRGELSGQESNGDMESQWSGIYNEVTPADLIAQESWVSDGSDVDMSEKREALEEELNFTKARLHTCTTCGAKLASLRELRTHRALAHAAPTCSKTYRQLVTARHIKKEERTEEVMTPGPNLLPLDSKDAIANSMLQVYDTIEAKPKIEAFIKQEVKRRRKDFICPTCKVDQLTDAAFHAHLKIHPLECLTCGKCFFRRANLALHIKTHLGIKNYKCEVCEKRFVTRQKLSEHHNTHTGRAPVKCTLCDDTFRRYSNMVQHRDRHHFQKKGKVRDYVCQCGSVFHSRAKLLWHRETHDDRPKACLYCSDKFVHTSSLTRHVRRSHNEYYLSEKNKGKVENVPCPVCKQVYLRTNLRAHLLTHSGKRPYLCIICNKSFTTKWNLKLHRWTHMSRSAKPFKCSLCKGAFIRQTEYISHMNAHKSVRPYTCNYCGCQFIRKYNCQRHVREHEMAKKYVCKVPECGKSFHRSYYLSEHMKVHSGARPFSCTICGKTSSNKSNHNKHVQIHHAREPIATEA